MNVEEYRQLVAESQAAVWRHHRGTDKEAPDLRPPAAPERIAAAGERLGTTIPSDLTTLLLAVDGGLVLGDGSSFCQVSPYQQDDEDRIPLVDATLAARDTVAQAEWAFAGRAEYQPQPDILALTDPGQYGFWYEVSGPNAGSILYYDVLALDWGIIEVAPSLDNLLLAARDSNQIAGEFRYLDATVHIFERYQIDRRLFR